MKLFDYVKSLFKKEHVNINNLINISDSFVIPTRQLFKENIEVLNLIDTYKSEYKKILSDKKLLFSMDLTNNINENMRMYSELVTNIFTKKESIESATETKVKMFYKINKLNLYKEEISRLNEECTARLVALLELFNERKMFMSKHKKDALLFAMNNLTSALVVFQAQRSAIEIEKENFLDKYTNLSTQHDNSNYDFIIKTFVEDKVNILNRVAPLINRKLIGNDIQDILLLEREFEIYVYNNKNGVSEIKGTIDDYYKLIDHEEGISSITLYEDIYDLERKALMYFYYGKDLISSDYMYKFYEIKLIYLINQKDFLALLGKTRTDIEEKAYVQAIDKRLDNIVRGKNPVIKKIFKGDSKEATERIINELKTGDSFDAKNISLLSSRVKFLFSFDYENGFINFLDSQTVRKGNDNSLISGTFSTIINIGSDIFTWDEFIPMSSVYELQRLGAIVQTPYLFNNQWYGLYKLYQKHLDHYKLPQGIKGIKAALFKDVEKDFKKKLAESAEGKKLVLPDSLEFFSGHPFSVETIEDIELNNNIKLIDMSLLGCTAEILNIPASLERIYDDIGRNYMLGFKFAWEYESESYYKRWYYLNNVGFKKLNTIIFHDYENSKLLQNKKSLRLLFADTLYIHKTINSCVLKTKVKTIVLKDDKRDLECTIDISDLEIPLGPENFVKNGAVENAAIDEFMVLVESKVSHCLNDDKSLMKR